MSKLVHRWNKRCFH